MKINLTQKQVQAIIDALEHIGSITSETRMKYIRIADELKKQRAIENNVLLQNKIRKNLKPC